MNWYKLIKFGQMKQNQNNFVPIMIAKIYGSSEGWNDRPAGDPTTDLRWDFYVKPSGWQFLNGQKITIRFDRYGSYHEQFFNLKAIANLPYDIYDQMENKELLENYAKYVGEEYWERNRKSIKEQSFIFTTFDDFFKKIHQIIK